MNAPVRVCSLQMNPPPLISLGTSELVSSVKSVLGLAPDELSRELASFGEKPFRAKQILEWVYHHRVDRFEAMTNLSKGLRESLAKGWVVYESKVVRRADSNDGTVKLLLSWADGATSECVLIPEEDRRTICISTQVGCPVGCRFCASGMDGLQRQLSAPQIVEQAMRLLQLLSADDRISNVVFMGLGEPLANFKNTLQAYEVLNAPWGMGIGARKITISTIGLPSQMRKLADLKLQINLALSIHAPNDDLRRQLIPWAENTTLEEIVQAGRYYFEQTGRELTLEYVLLAGVNDQPAHARDLAQLSKRLRSNVNLIPYNPVPELGYDRPTDSAMRGFLTTLRDAGVNAHLRRSRGLDIDSACGQLRKRHQAGR